MATLPVTKQARALEVPSRPPSKRWRSNNTVPESCAYCADASPSSSPISDKTENPSEVVDLSVPVAANANTGTLERTPANAPTTPPWWGNNDNNSSSISDGFELNNTMNKVSVTPELPDEVLVAVLRFVPSAATLWKLRAVCRRWRTIIDTQSSVWRHVSFKGLLLNRSVVTSPNVMCSSINKNINTKVLTLGPRHGASAVALAATAGNEWASFLSMCLFGTVPLKALTVVQPLANLLVSDNGNNASKFETRERPPESNYKHGWVVIHAARRGPQDLPRGALVGMIRVSDAVQNGNNQWSWTIEEKVKVKLPLRCAGYVGLWSLSRPLTEILVRALHTQ